ncbi:MAG: phosphoribosylamine--glycine ligase [Candidatus Promineifilaceae bacterium]
MGHLTGLRALVVGGGGREHALAWALARSPQVGQVYVAPGNAGTAWERAAGRAPAERAPIAAEDTAGLLAFARRQGVGLTVIGPEGPLAAGLADALAAAGLPAFGPSAAAARLEASKAFAKAFMQAEGIPTARFGVFDRFEAARAFLADFPAGAVVKASGLAAGKGVIVCADRAAAERAAREMLEGAFGPAGELIVIEERLEGPELSLLALCDGRNIRPMPSARDHKRVLDGDQGPNTGGMGAYAPVPGFGPQRLDELQATILEPAVRGLAARGIPYRGVLYAGLMLAAEGPKVLEFNCRFGDPEAQAILPLLASDLAEALLACAQGRLDEVELAWRPEACATVVMASAGYPGPYSGGRPIQGLAAAEALPGVTVFQAGTARQNGQVLTSGGRVLAVSGRGENLDAALERAYFGVAQIHFDGAHYRRDIGRRLPAGQPVPAIG